MGFSKFFNTYETVEPPPIIEPTIQLSAPHSSFVDYVSKPTKSNDITIYPVTKQKESFYRTDFSPVNKPAIRNTYLTNNTTDRQRIETFPVITDPSLVNVDIEDLLKQEGITSVNGKKIKFGSRSRRADNTSYGVKNSHHKEIDQHTGYANARDISIVGGTDKDYADFRKMLLDNDRIRQWFSQKKWGIINEITPYVMRRTNATGRHFHFGPDQWAVRTWRGWIDNPNIDVTKVF